MKLEINDKFTISYYAKKHKSIIFRKGKWTNLSREWVSKQGDKLLTYYDTCLLYTSPSPRDLSTSRMPSSA